MKKEMKKKINMSLDFFSEDKSDETNETQGENTTDKEESTTGIEDNKENTDQKENKDNKEVKEKEQNNYVTADKLQEMLKNEREKIVKDALKLSSMSEEERKQHEESEKVKSLEEREIAIALRELKIETENLLMESGLNKSLAGFVMGQDTESTKDKIKLFKETFDTSVQEQVTKRLKGRTPDLSNSDSKGSIATAREEIRKGLRGI